LAWRALERRRGPSAGCSTRIRTGMRCTTFTQLPEAGLMLSTLPRQVTPG
jgi:hypothetical protein